MDFREDSDDLRVRLKVEERQEASKLTILVAESFGSITYFDRFGDTAGLLLLLRHDKFVTRTIEESGGTVFKRVGDSIMAEFPEPLLAVTAAIAVQRQLHQHNQKVSEGDRFQVRTGVSCGAGFRSGDDL